MAGWMKNENVRRRTRQGKENDSSEYARSPTLQTVFMVEKFIDEHSGKYRKTELFNNLPRKAMWQTFQVIMKYLESIHKIGYDSEEFIVYIWNPAFYEKVKNRKDIQV